MLLERDAITQAARELPRPQREVLACRFLLDLTVAETAATLKLPAGTVKSYTARALARMRELLDDDSLDGVARPSLVRLARATAAGSGHHSPVLVATPSGPAVLIRLSSWRTWD